jgi:hypothetical protein
LPPAGGCWIRLNGGEILTIQKRSNVNGNGRSRSLLIKT